MDSELLSYGGLQTVLQYMEPNLRFKLSYQIPSIRSAEKAVPIKMRYLSFDVSTIRVNETVYKLGIYRDYRGTEVPEYTQRNNEKGGVGFDLDEWGLPDLSTGGLTPGDIVIGNPKRPIAEPIPRDVRLQQCQRLLGMTEGTLAIINAQLNPPNREGERVVPLSNIMESQVNALREEISALQKWRDGIPLAYDMLIQLTITSPNETKIQRTRYNFKLHEALKRLCCTIFQDRRIIQVGSFGVISDVILRLPLGFKLKIQGLSLFVEVEHIYNSLKPIINESSYPLNRLEIYSFLNQSFEQPIIRSAQQLIIWNVERDPWLDILQNLPNRYVHLKFDGFGLSNEERIVLARNWLETGRPINTCFTFGIMDERMCIEFLDLVKERFERGIAGQKSVTFPMNSTLDLVFSYRHYVDTDYVYKSLYEKIQPNWILKMEVLPHESE